MILQILYFLEYFDDKKLVDAMKELKVYRTELGSLYEDIERIIKTIILFHS